MQTKKYWKSGKPSNLRVSCDTPDGDSCACQSAQHPPQLRLLGLCAQKSKSDAKVPRNYQPHFIFGTENIEEK